MNKWTLGAYCLFLCLGAGVLMSANKAEMKIGTVNVKKCIEGSLAGKKEQAQFEQQRKQMEERLEKKQKELNELAPKLSEEYLDSLTPESEKELREKFQRLSAEFSEQQQQFFQMLDQAQYQSMQTLYSLVAKATETVAKEKHLDLVFNDDACFYRAEGMDVSSEVITALDALQVATEKK